MAEGPALYIHLPFCRSICPYCDFPVARYGAGGVDAYLDAVIAELRTRADGLRPSWIYVGGGTPTELSERETGRFLESLQAALRLDVVEEWSVECNPKTYEPAVLRAWRDAGATRLSLGAQSFDARRLQRLGRAHRAVDVAAAVDDARAAGFAQVSLDLIVAVDDETPAEAAADAEAALALAPDHVSVYTLTIEAGTPFARLADDGRLRGPDPETQIAQVTAVRDVLGAAGLVPYEVSNCARPGAECRMHLGYWSGGDYVGVGVGAASHRAGTRTRNTRDVAGYVAAVAAGRDAVAESETLSPPRRAAEMAMLGLRLPRGFTLADVSARAGCDAAALLLPALLRLAAQGVCAIENDRVRPTRHGLAVADAAARVVFAALTATAAPARSARPGDTS